jgi:hypothetical protein
VLTTNRPSTPPTPEQIRARPDREALEYRGSNCSAELLPGLGLSWATLSALRSTCPNPIGDFGAAFSSFAVEGALRQIGIVPVDIHAPPVLDRYTEQMEFSLRPVVGVYGGVRSLGHEFDSGVTVSRLPHELESRISRAVEQTHARYVHADIAHLPFEDRFFSLSVAHHSVPKHSGSLDTFLKYQLPELLRVTAQELRIVPLALYETEYVELGGPFGERQRVSKAEWRQLPDNRRHYDLIESLPLYRDQSKVDKVAAVAERAGFRLTLASPKLALVGRAGVPPEGIQQGSLAVFTRFKS